MTTIVIAAVVVIAVVLITVIGVVTYKKKRGERLKQKECVFESSSLSSTQWPKFRLENERSFMSERTDELKKSKLSRKFKGFLRYLTELEERISILGLLAGQLNKCVFPFFLSFFSANCAKHGRYNLFLLYFTPSSLRCLAPQSPLLVY